MLRSGVEVIKALAHGLKLGTDGGFVAVERWDNLAERDDQVVAEA